MEIRTVQRLRAQLNASEDPLNVVERKPMAEDTAKVLQAQDKLDLDWEVKEPQANQVCWPEPAGLLRLVIRREHHQHDLP